MKHLKTYEQYNSSSEFKAPDHNDILKHLSGRKGSWSMAEIESIFPDAEKTKKALAILMSKDLIENDTDGYKVITNDHEITTSDQKKLNTGIKPGKKQATNPPQMRQRIALNMI